MNLPAGSIGNEVVFIDYAGTFDSNTFTIAANGSEKIAGSDSRFDSFNRKGRKHFSIYRLYTRLAAKE